MSAYIVDKEHVIYLVKAAQAWGRLDPFVAYLRDRLKAGNLYAAIEAQRPDVAVAQLLWDANVAAVKWKYPDGVLPGYPGPWTVSEADLDSCCWPTFDAPQVGKALLAYEYQCSDWPLWDYTFAKQFCDMMARAVVQRLPDWEGLEWGAPRPLPKEVA